MSETADCILRSAARLGAPGEAAAYVGRQCQKLEAAKGRALSEGFLASGFGRAVGEAIDEAVAELDAALAIMAEKND